MAAKSFSNYDFDTWNNVVPAPKPKETTEKKEEKEVKKTSEPKEGSLRSQATKSRIIGGLVSMTLAKLVGVIMFMLLGGMLVFSAGFSERESYKTGMEQSEKAFQERQAQTVGDTGMTYDEYIRYRASGQFLKDQMGK